MPHLELRALSKTEAGNAGIQDWRINMTFKPVVTEDLEVGRQAAAIHAKFEDFYGPNAAEAFRVNMHSLAAQMMETYSYMANRELADFFEDLAVADAGDQEELF